MSSTFLNVTDALHRLAAVPRGTRIPSLRRLRVERLLRQEDLAALAGLNRSTVARIEAENKAADLETIRRLATALGVTPAELMAADQSSTPTRSTE